MSELLKPRVAIFKTSGINCDAETAYAFDLAGGSAEIVMGEDLRTGEKKLSDFQILTFPGGFSYGDDLGSGTVAALELDTYLGNQIERFKEKGLILGVCNGFQILTRSGLLPMGTLGERGATLDRNDNGKFVSRRVNLSVEPNNCVFLKDLSSTGPYEFQVAHGEGKLVMPPDIRKQVEVNGQVVFRYVNAEGLPTQEYPANPNGSEGAIAGICDPTGRILGLMPHPERSVSRSQYPNSRRLPESFVPEGLAIFQNMIEFARVGV
ncbi:MAG: phosphoribosylformylglycinamidine synthase I [Candidatus Levybacteria bacterium]|nr:phosphoribosylformylglycinamidine synthase I [Candidatus Levybacteria bacterium]